MSCLYMLSPAMSAPAIQSPAAFSSSRAAEMFTTRAISMCSLAPALDFTAAAVTGALLCLPRMTP